MSLRSRLCRQLPVLHDTSLLHRDPLNQSCEWQGGRNALGPRSAACCCIWELHHKCSLNHQCKCTWILLGTGRHHLGLLLVPPKVPRGFFKPYSLFIWHGGMHRNKNLTAFGGSRSVPPPWPQGQSSSLSHHGPMGQSSSLSLLQLQGLEELCTPTDYWGTCAPACPPLCMPLW